MSGADRQKLLDDAARRHGVPGGVLAILDQGKLSVVTTGVLSVDTGEAVRPDSLFQIGSITKVLTATLLMTQVDRGRVELDSPIRTYLPDFRTADIEAVKAITVRQLLCHTSGLDGDFFTDTGNGPGRLLRFLDRCALLPQLFDPGTDFSYSNVAYNVAGRIVETVTGMDFDTALKRLLFEPLGLKQSVVDPYDMPGRSLAAGHVPDPDSSGGSKQLETLFTLAVSSSPAGATTMMSAADLVAFAQMHLTAGQNAAAEAVLSPTAVAAMQDEQVRIPVPSRGLDAWGLGWFFQDVDGCALIGHDGATVGQNAYLRIDRKSGSVGVLFANGGSANDFFLDVFRESYDPLVGCPSPQAPPVAASSPDDLGPYAGVYRNIVGDTRVEVKDGTLVKSSAINFDDTVIEQPEVTMDYIGDDSFSWRLPNQVFPGTTSFRMESGKAQSLFSGLRWHHRVE